MYAPKTVMQLSHFSVRENLVSSRIREGDAAGYGLQERPTHESIAECCLAYLLDKKVCSSVVVSTYPLARYSARFWPEHAWNAGQDCSKVVILGRRLLSPGSDKFQSWLRVFDVEKYWLHDDVPRSMPLYYMALYGVHCLASVLINDGSDINAQGRYYGSALQAALVNGYVEIAQLLLDKGANVNAPG